MGWGWTSERRRSQANGIRRGKPWTRSTGPRTIEGEARAARNADRGGQRRARRETAKALNVGLRAQRESVGEVITLATRWHEHQPDTGTHNRDDGLA